MLCQRGDAKGNFRYIYSGKIYNEQYSNVNIYLVQIRIFYFHFFSFSEKSGDSPNFLCISIFDFSPKSGDSPNFWGKFIVDRGGCQW